MKLSCIAAVLLLLIPAIFAFDAQEYQYTSTIRVLCDEYKGYVQFEMPAEYRPGMSVYMNRSLWIADANSYFVPQQNWYVKDTTGVSEAGVAAVHDGSWGSTYSVIQSQAEVFPFVNPVPQTVRKISIDLRDSEIVSASVLVRNKLVPLTMTQDLFHYELLLNESVTTDALTLTLRLDSAVHIREITFFSQASAPKAFGYFYVDNDCKEPAQLYFGAYGDSSYAAGAQTLPVVFSTLVTTRMNPDYNTDFDNDTVLNPSDNCLRIANSDQKDINYNSVGDACEDDDWDGASNAADNCVAVANYDQADVDKDGIGDACDESDDRFFEKNANFVYVIAGLIVLAFGFFAVKIVKDKKE